MHGVSLKSLGLRSWFLVRLFVLGRPWSLVLRPTFERPPSNGPSREGYEARTKDQGLSSNPDHLAVHPPSTNSALPVTYDAASDARKTTAPASSCNSPHRPIGI